MSISAETVLDSASVKMITLVILTSFKIHDNIVLFNILRLSKHFSTVRNISQLHDYLLKFAPPSCFP